MRSGQTFLLQLGMFGALGGGMICLFASQSSNAPRANVAPIVRIADGVPQSYDDWVTGAIARLAGDDEQAQNNAADQFRMAVVYPPARDKVLAALAVHLNSNSRQLRVKCVKAYGHWSTDAQIKQLVDVVANPPHPPAMSGDAPAWSSAIATLVRLDPKSAATALQTRVGDFFFRNDMIGQLVALTSDTSAAQSAAFDLLKEIDPNNAAVQLSISDAEKLMQSDAANDRTHAATALAHSVIDPKERKTVLDLLKSHLMSDSGPSRAPFVQAYSHWADQECVPTLLEVIAFPGTVKPVSGHEDSWAAATAALGRLDPAAASAAVKKRSDDFFFHGSLHHQLDPVAEGPSPASDIAAWLLSQLEQPGGQQPPLPPDFDPAKNGMVVPAKKPDGTLKA